MKIKKIISVLLAAVLFVTALSLASCGGENGTETPTSENATANGQKSTGENQTEPEEETVKYNLAPEDFNKFEFDILNVEKNFWNMNTALAPAEYTSDLVSNQIYDRNMTVEGLYNCIIAEHADFDFYSISTSLTNLVLSGSNTYDAAYIEGQQSGNAVGSGVVQNLYSIPELQIKESWWSQLIRQECTIGTGRYASLFFTQSNLSLVPFDLTWCLYFNKAMYEDLQFEDDLYQMVRDGKWTVEAMHTKAAAAKNLNGDEDFAYSNSGKAIYGFTTYWNGIKALVVSSNVHMIERDEDGNPIENIGGEIFVNACQKIAGFCGDKGAFTNGASDSAGLYLDIFNSKRALFLGAEIKSSISDLKGFGDFGILPFPKADETAPTISWVNYLATVLVIPSDVKGETLHKAATLLDVLSFYSDLDVMPFYYEKVLQGRGAKDPDSLEMLDLINTTRAFDVGLAFRWSGDFTERLCTEFLMNGMWEVSGLVDSYKPLITEAIAKTMKTLQ